MEDYDGVAILATNLRANLDEAFTRRLQFIVNFPFPDEEYRRKIWNVLMPPDLPCENDLDFDMMADRFKLSGGSIRNIIVSAAYFAAANGGVVNMDHLMHGARREKPCLGSTTRVCYAGIRPSLSTRRSTAWATCYTLSCNWTRPICCRPCKKLNQPCWVLNRPQSSAFWSLFRSAARRSAARPKLSAPSANRLFM